MDRRGWRSPLLHFIAHRPKIFGRDFRQQPIAERRQYIALVDRAAHRASAFGHPVLLQPAFAKLAKALCFLDAALLALLLLGGRPPLLNRALCVDQLFPSTGERKARWPVSAEGQGLASTVHTVVIAEHDGARRVHDDIHTVTVGDLV